MFRPKGLIRRIVAVAVAAITVSALLAGPTQAAQEFSLLNFRLAGLTATTATFQWSTYKPPATPDPIIYRLYRDGVVVKRSAASSITVSDLVPGQTNTYWADAVDGAGDVTAPTPRLTVTTRAPGAPPTTGSNLRTTAVTPGSATLAWDRPTDEFDIDSYRIYDGATPVKTVQAAFWLDTTTKIRHLTPGTTHTFTVRAVRRTGESPASNAATVDLPGSTDTQPPTAPANLRVRDVDGCGVWELSWTASTDNVDPQNVIEYEVFDNGNPSVTISRAMDGVVQGLTTVSPYANQVPTNTFSVRALDTSGNVSPLVSVTAPFAGGC